MAVHSGAPDIDLRHPLHTRRDDVPAQDYVERQVSRLVEHDTRHGTELLPTLRHYLDAGEQRTGLHVALLMLDVLRA